MKKWLPLTHSTITVTDNISFWGIMMKTSLVFFLLTVEFSFTFGQKISSENENQNNTSINIMSTVQEEFKNESKGREKSFNFYANQPQTDYVIMPDRKLIIDPKAYYGQFVDDNPGIPYLGFSVLGNQGQNIYLSDRTGKYSLQLENFQPKKPSHFQTALGAISAHITNQRNNQEYIPYFPNGNPYNYPAYRGHSGASEPPEVRAYERATNSNYDVQPVDFEQQNLRRIFSNNAYEASFSSQYRNPELSFYSEPDFFKNHEYSTQLSKSYEPLHKPQWYN